MYEKVENLVKMLKEGIPIQVPNYQIDDLMEEWVANGKPHKLRIGIYNQSIVISPIDKEEEL